jgi:putative spermidine/putrescine transport system substrate-binding protein
VRFVLVTNQATEFNAAKLAREYILSDAGQINLAKGNARPIRAEHLTLPAEVQSKLLPQEQYAKVQPIKDAAAWENTSKALPRLWQEHVIINMN